MLRVLIKNWVYGGAVAAVLLLLVTPLLMQRYPLLSIAVFLHLPAYMIHQCEEHFRDRFRIFLNATIGKGREALSPLGVFVINVPGVWGVLAVSIYAALEVNAGWSLIAVYLVLVNAFVHIAHSLFYRRYNPGLVTAIFIFVPLGTWTLTMLQKLDGRLIVYHIAGLMTAILFHIAILLHIRRRLASTGS